MDADTKKDDRIIQLFYFVYFYDIITYRKEVRHEW